ncbi:hypothetical protein DAEQUDRAFT_806982 [Daedalea quercina L-15889]|uniref:Protein CPL1-like domain-containing protein n=1 Tax=Daedalea quercina L-15889 TaxID=1314783 RepID=A0A165UAK8_9APHY|nr:hypothetical protein DAEQUDRAFT_806982 [Daedalea quercina L-15889]
MARFTSLLLLAAATLPFVFATSSDDCADNEFFYDAKSCCAPQGGISNPPSPPQGENQCPTSGWYWHPEKECCLPKQPQTPSSPPPQCGGNWFWNEGSSTCCTGGSTTTSTTPTPSANASKKRDNIAHKRAVAKARRSVLTCPDDMYACPISGLTGPTGDFECIDPKAELESCGGCVSTGEGQDCTAIEGVWNVGCEQGHCAIYTCAQGYKLSTDGASCLKL